MFLINNKSELLNQLSQGTLLITPNNRLSSSLLNDYYIFKKQNTLEKPLCMSFNQFLNYLYQQIVSNQPGSDIPHLLSEHQSRFLWQQILNTQTGIIFSKGLLRTVIDSWKKCLQWNIAIDHENFKSTQQYELFQKWWMQFNNKLNALNAVCLEQILDMYRDLNHPIIQTNITWVCFDYFTPQQQNFQHYLSQKNIHQFQYDLHFNNSEHRQYAAKDNDDETQHMIHWIKQRLARGDENIAVVVPDLHHRSSILQRQLSAVFGNEKYNLSLGKPLMDYPLAAHALNWLALNKKLIPHHCYTHPI